MEHVELLGASLHYSLERSNAESIRWVGEHRTGVRIELSYHSDGGIFPPLRWCVSVRDVEGDGGVIVWGPSVDVILAKIEGRALRTLRSQALVAGVVSASVRSEAA